MLPGRESAGQSAAALRALTFVALAAALPGLGACSSSKSGATDGGPGTGGAGAGGAPMVTDGGADAAGATTGANPADAGTGTCQQIRLCAFNCTSEACVDTCRQRGSAAAQAAFQAVTSCTEGSAADGGGGCPPVSDPGYRNCLCLAQCLEDPPCAATLDPCLGNLDDSVCDACDS